MKKIILLSVIIFSAISISAQKVDSIYFHLYTDSLKKGTHNYINVDGKLADGRWLPLTEKEIQFSATYGSFSGNELILPWEPKQEKVTVKAVLKTNPSVWIEKTIWIKKNPDGPLPTKDDLFNEKSPTRNKVKNNRKN